MIGVRQQDGWAQRAGKVQGRETYTQAHPQVADRESLCRQLTILAQQPPALQCAQRSALLPKRDPCRPVLPLS